MPAWTGTPALPPFLAGDVPSAAADWAAIVAALHGLADAWTPYAPGASLWASTGTQPALGNAVTDCAFIRANKFFAYVGSITMGSTTTYGTAAYLIGAPVTFAATERAIGMFWMNDASTPANNRVGGLLGGGFTTQFAPLTSGGNVSPSNPFTWAVSDQMKWAIVGEVA